MIKKLSLIALSSAMLFIVFSTLLYALGIRFNLTPSIPVGFYLLTDKEPNIGEYAWFCPPDGLMVKEAIKRRYIFRSKQCKSGSPHFMKKVTAKKGDSVTINNKGVYVNKKLVDYSIPVAKDKNGLALYVNILDGYVLQEGEYLMMTDRLDKSFDSRYFGIVTDDVFKIEEILCL